MKKNDLSTLDMAINLDDERRFSCVCLWPFVAAKRKPPTVDLLYINQHAINLKRQFYLGGVALLADTG